MRFQFCGNVSCPEWFIAQIAVLTKITAVKMKLVFNQLVTLYLQGQDISAKVTKLLNGTGLDVYEMNAVASTLNFILYNAVKFHVSDSTLNKQLIDLGLPKENVQSITKTYKSNRDKLLEKSTQKMLRISSGLKINYSIHEFLGSQRLGSQNINPVPFAELELNYNDVQEGENTKSMLVCEQELDQLIYELEDALSIVEKLQANK